ncbi:hypothetical protein AB0K68_33840 [Streptomyces sp. NPDC050698]
MPTSSGPPSPTSPNSWPTWKYGAATIYWDNGATGRYGFGLFDRRSLAVTQQGFVNAIMSGVGSSAVRAGLPSGT